MYNKVLVIMYCLCLMAVFPEVCSFHRLSLCLCEKNNNNVLIYFSCRRLYRSLFVCRSRFSSKSFLQDLDLDKIIEFTMKKIKHILF